MYKLFHVFVFISVTLFVFVDRVEAFVPDFVDPKSSNEIFTIDEPTLLQAFHGELDHFPHTYEITIDKPTLLHVEILVPDIDSSQNIISGIIIKEQETGGRVIEVAHLIASEALWQSRFRQLSGDSYLGGPIFEEEIDSGTYRVEVHTPDNIGKYTLVIGTEDEMDVGYFKLIERLVETKRFFEKTPLLIIQSPYVYVPVIVILGIWLFIRFSRKRSNIKTG